MMAPFLSRDQSTQHTSRAGFRCRRVICSYRSKVVALTVSLTESESQRSRYYPTFRLSASKMRPRSASAIACRKARRASVLVFADT